MFYFRISFYFIVAYNECYTYVLILLVVSDLRAHELKNAAHKYLNKSNIFNCTRGADYGGDYNAPN